MGVASALAPASGQNVMQGTYAATVKVSGTETQGKTKKIAYEAEIRLDLPFKSASSFSIISEVDTAPQPSAKVLITKWSLEERNASPDSDGKITSWKCELAAPTTVKAQASGNFGLNYREKKYSMFVAVTSVDMIPVNCVNSRSGPYKDETVPGFFFGTNEPDNRNELPYTDPAQIRATYTLVPNASMKDQYLPQAQTWTLIRKN
jgi:hypothetical protein